MAEATEVISGLATLDIAPFLAALQALQTEVLRVGQAINASLSSIGGKAVGVEAVGAATKQMSSEMATAKSNVDTFSNSLGGAEKSLKALEDELNAVHRAGSQIASLGTQIGLLGGAILGLMDMSIKSATQLDFWTRRAEAAAGATSNLTTAMQGMPAGEFQAAIEGIANAVGVYKPDQVAEATYKWISATGEAITTSQELAQVSQQVQKILQAGAISGMDYGAAITGISAAEHDFNVNVQDTSHVVDVLTTVARQTNAEFSDILNSFNYVGPMAHAMGLQLEDVAGIFGELADNGIKGTRAGQAIGQVLASLGKPSKQAQETLQRLLVTNNGLSGSWADVIDKGGKFVGLTDTITNGVMTQQGVIGMLHDALNKESEAQAAYDLKTLGSQNMLRALTPLINSYKDGVTKLADGQTQALDPATRFKQQLEDTALQGQLFGKEWDLVSQSIAVTWGSQMNRLQEAIAAFGVIAEQSLLPLIKTIVNLVEGIENWISTHQQLAEELGRFVAVAAAVLTALGSMGFVLGNLVKAAVGFQLAFKSIGTVFFALVDGVGPLIPLLLALVAGLVALNTYANSTPELQKLFGNLAQSLKDMLGVATTVVGNFISLISALIHGNYQQAWTDFSNIVAVAVAGVGSVFSALGALVQNQIQALVTWLNLTFNGMGTDLEQWGENIITAFANGMTNAIASAVIPAINGILDVFSNFLEGHSPAKEGPLSHVTEWGQSIIEAYVGGMKDANLQAVVDAGTMIGDALQEALKAKGKSADWSGYEAEFLKLRDEVQKINDTLQQGGQVGADAWKDLDAALGPYAKDLEAVVEAQAKYNAMQDQVTTTKAMIQEKQDQVQKIETDQVQPLQKQVNQNNFKKDSDNLAIAKLEQQKNPYEDDKNSLQEQKDNLEYQKNQIAIQHDNLQAQIDQEEQAVQPLRDQVAQNNIDKQLLQDKVQLLDDQKQKIQEVIDGISRQYQLEHAQQQESISLLKDQIDLQKAKNDLANQPLENTANKAKDNLDALKEKFQLQEEPLQEQIDMMKAAGDSAGAAALQKQLSQLQALHKAQIDPLQLAADKANSALSAQQRSQAEALQPTQDQYNLQAGQAAVDDAQQKLNTQVQVDNLKAQQALLDDQALVYKDQITAINEQNAGLNEQILLKTEDEQRFKDEQQNLQLRMDAIDREEKNLDLRMQADDLAEKKIDDLEKPYKDDIKALDLQNQNLQHQIQAIQLFQEGPIKDNIAQLQLILQGQEAALSVASSNLSTAKSLLSLGKQVTSALSTQATKNGATAAPDIPGGPSPSDVAGLPGVSGPGIPAAFNLHIDNPFAKLSADLQNKANAIQAGMGKTFDDFMGHLKAASNGVGIGANNAASNVFPLAAMAGGSGVIGDFLYSLLRGKAPGDVLGEDGKVIKQSFGNRFLGPAAGKTMGFLGDFAPGALDAFTTPFRALIAVIKSADPGNIGKLASNVGELFGKLRDIGAGVSSVPGRIAGANSAFMGRLFPTPTPIPSFLTEPPAPPKSLLQPEMFLGPDFVMNPAVDRIGTGIPSEGPLHGPDLAEFLFSKQPSLPLDLNGLNAGGKSEGILIRLGSLLGGGQSAAGVARMPDEIGAADKTGGAIGSAFTKLKDILGPVQDALGKIRDLVGSVFGKAGDVAKFVDSLQPLEKLLSGIRTAAAPVIESLGKFFEILSKIPGVGNVLKAIPIVGDILMIVQTVESARKAWDTNWNGIQTALTTTWSQIRPIFNLLGMALGDKNLNFGDKVGLIGTTLGAALKDLGTNLQPVVQKTWKQITDAIGSFFQNLGPELSSFWTNYGQSWVTAAGSLFTNLVGGLVNLILANAIPWALQLVGAFATTIANFINGIDAALKSGNGNGGAFGQWFQDQITALVGFIGANWQTWATNIGTALAQAFQGVFDIVEATINLGFDFVSGKIGGSGALMDTLRVAVLAVAGALGVITAQMLVEAGTAIVAFVASIPAIIAGFIAWAAAAGTAAVATIAATWPVLAIGAALAALGFAIVKVLENREKIGAFFSDLGTKAKAFTDAAGPAIGGFFNVLGADARSFLDGAGKDIGDFFSGFGGAASAALSAAASTIGSIFSSIGTTIHNFVDDILRWAGDTWGNFYNTMIGPVKRTELDVLLVFFSITDGIQQAVNGILKWLTPIWNGIVQTITGPLNEVEKEVDSIWKSIQTTISTWINQITAVLTTWIGDRQRDLNGFLSTISKAFGDTWKAIEGTVTQWIGTIATDVSQWITAREQDFTTFMNNVLSTFDSIKTKIIQKFQDILKAGADWAGNLISGAWNALSDTATGIWAKVSQALNDVITKMASLAKSFMDAASSLAGNIVSGMVSGMGSLAKSVGDAMGTGLQNAIKSISFDLGPFHMHNGQFKVDAISLPGFGISNPGGSSGGSKNDGQTFSNQSKAVQQAYTATYGANAASQWQKDHDKGPGGGGFPGADDNSQGEAVAQQAEGWLDSYAYGSGSNTFCERFTAEREGREVQNRAIDAYQRRSALGQIQQGMDPPPGAEVFFAAASSNEGDGHDGISIGGGKFVSVTVDGVKVYNIADWNANSWGAPYLGWVPAGTPLPAYEQGTDSALGGYALVGEGGPELVSMPKGSKVTSNNNLAGVLGQALNATLYSLESSISALCDTLSSSIDRLTSTIGKMESQQAATVQYNANFTVDRMYATSPQSAKQWANYMNQLRFQTGNS